MHTTFCLSIHFLIVIWDISTFGLLGIVLLRMVVSKCLCGRAFSLVWVYAEESELLGSRAALRLTI